MIGYVPAANALHSKVGPIPVRALDFGVVLWFLATVSLVFVFAASSYFIPLFLLGLIASTVLMVIVVFSGGPAISLMLALVFVVAFNASYHPLFGIISGVQGMPSGIYRIALGFRSAWFAAALVFVICYAFAQSRKYRESLLLPMIWTAVVVLTSIGLSHAPLDSRIAYTFNSFIPLFTSICCIGLIYRMDPIPRVDATRLVHLVIGIMVVGAIYFPLLPLTYDFFRPDLASFLRARPGEYIPVGGYDPSWGTRIFGYVTNRFVGSFPDPIICGYFLACTSFAMLVTGFRKYAFFLSFLLFISLSKGAWLLLFQAIILLWVMKRWPRLGIPTAIAFVGIQLVLSTVLELSSRLHYLGLVGGITSVLSGGPKALLIGFGVGEGGNLARGYVEGGALGGGWLGSGSESGVGVLFHQIGMLGASALAFLTLVVFSILAKFDQAESAGPGGRTYAHAGLAGKALLLSLLVNMPLQENCINASVVSSVLLGILIIRALAPRSSLTVMAKVTSRG